MSKEIERYNNYDLLRIVSTIAVVIIHVNAHFFASRAGEPSFSLIFAVESLLNIITRFSVPVFAMISGAFILGNPSNRDYSSFYRKSGYKIFLPSFVLMLFYCLLSEIKWIVTSHNPLPPLYALLIGGQYNLWFMYMLFGLYLLAPFVIRLKEVIGRKTYKTAAYFLLLWSVVSQMTSSSLLPYSIGVVFAFLAYFLVGNVLFEEIKTCEKPTHAAGWFCAGAVCFVFTFFSRCSGLTHELFDPYTSFFSPTIALASVFIFVGFGTLNVRWNCAKLSSLTFFVYLFHTPIYGVLFRFKRFLPGNELLTIAVVVVLTIFLSAIAAELYSKLWSVCESKWNWKNRWYSLPIWNKELTNIK